jgi:5-dehydro-4-deoxyglucarate dehydratase
VVSGDVETQRQLLRQVIEPICRIRDLRRGYAVAYVKAAVNQLGLLGPEGAGPVRPPLVDLEPQHHAALAALLATVSTD